MNWSDVIHINRLTEYPVGEVINRCMAYDSVSQRAEGEFVERMVRKRVTLTRGTEERAEDWWIVVGVVAGGKEYPVEQATDLGHHHTFWHPDYDRDSVLDPEEPGWEVSTPFGSPYCPEAIAPCLVRSWYTVGGWRQFTILAIQETRHQVSDGWRPAVQMAEAWWATTKEQPIAGAWQTGAGDLVIKDDGQLWPVGIALPGRTVRSITGATGRFLGHVRHWWPPPGYVLEAKA